MKILRGIIEEVISLFVDDWLFAVLLVGWVGVIALCGRSLPADLGSPLYFAGIAALVITFVIRKARQIKP